MSDPRIEKLAGILVDYSVKVRRGDIVMIDFSGFRPLPLVQEIYKKCLRRRAIAVEYNFGSEDLNRIFYEEADDRQLRHFPGHRLQAMKKATVYIGINGTENVQNFCRVDTAKMVKREKVLRPIITAAWTARAGSSRAID